MADDRDPAEVAREEVDLLVAAVQRLVGASTHDEIERAHMALREALEPARSAQHRLIEIIRCAQMRLTADALIVISDGIPGTSAWDRLKKR